MLNTQLFSLQISTQIRLSIKSRSDKSLPNALFLVLTNTDQKLYNGHLKIGLTHKLTGVLALPDTKTISPTNELIELMRAKRNTVLENIKKAAQGKTEPLLVINRGYGRGDYNFNYCLLDFDFPYLIENHIICIEPENKMTKETLIEYYKKIINSISNTKTKKFIDLYFGNNAMNIKELGEMVPIYINI